jgi:hypothetical protein
VPWLRFNLYYFGLNDQRRAIVSFQRTHSTFGLRLYEPPRRGWLDYELESVLQSGNTNHLAHFHHVDLGYSFDLPWTPRFLVFYDYASGDRNSTDNQNSAFDPLFGARRFEYMPTGNFGPFFLQRLDGHFSSSIASGTWRRPVEPLD